MGRFLAVILAIVVAIGVLDAIEPNGYGFFSKVGNGKVAVVTRFGEAQDNVLEAGFHTKGFFDVLNPMSVQKQSASLQISAFSKDIQQVSVYETINYNVDKNNAVTLFRDVGKNYLNSLIAPRMNENTKIVFSDYTAEQLITNREKLSQAVTELMRVELAPYGINVVDIIIEDLDFTDAFTNAVEAKQVATQTKLAAQTEQERLTMEAEAEANRQTLAVQAQAEQQKIRAEAEAYATEVKASAEAEANKKISESLTIELIDYTKAQAWNGELPIYMGSSTPVLDLTDTAE